MSKELSLSDLYTPFGDKKMGIETPDRYSSTPLARHHLKEARIEITREQYENLFESIKKDKESGVEGSLIKNNCAEWVGSKLKLIGIQAKTTLTFQNFLLRLMLRILPKSIGHRVVNWCKKQPKWVQKAALFNPVLYPVVIAASIIVALLSGKFKSDFSILNAIFRPWEVKVSHPIALYDWLDTLKVEQKKYSILNAAPRAQTEIGKAVKSTSEVLGFSVNEAGKLKEREIQHITQHKVLPLPLLIIQAIFIAIVNKLKTWREKKETINNNTMMLYLHTMMNQKFISPYQFYNLQESIHDKREFQRQVIGIVSSLYKRKLIDRRSFIHLNRQLKHGAINEPLQYLISVALLNGVNHEKHFNTIQDLLSPEVQIEINKHLRNYQKNYHFSVPGVKAIQAFVSRVGCYEWAQKITNVEAKDLICGAIKAKDETGFIRSVRYYFNEQLENHDLSSIEQKILKEMMHAVEYPKAESAFVNFSNLMQTQSRIYEVEQQLIQLKEKISEVKDDITEEERDNLKELHQNFGVFIDSHVGYTGSATLMSAMIGKLRTQWEAIDDLLCNQVMPTSYERDFWPDIGFREIKPIPAASLESENPKNHSESLQWEMDAAKTLESHNLAFQISSEKQFIQDLQKSLKVELEPVPAFHLYDEIIEDTFIREIENMMENAEHDGVMVKRKAQSASLENMYPFIDLHQPNRENFEQNLANLLLLNEKINPKGVVPSLKAALWDAVNRNQYIRFNLSESKFDLSSTLEMKDLEYAVDVMIRAVKNSDDVAARNLESLITLVNRAKKEDRAGTKPLIERLTALDYYRVSKILGDRKSPPLSLEEIKDEFSIGNAFQRLMKWSKLKTSRSRRNPFKHGDERMIDEQSLLEVFCHYPEELDFIQSLHLHRKTSAFNHQFTVNEENHLCILFEGEKTPVSELIGNFHIVNDQILSTGNDIEYTYTFDRGLSKIQNGQHPVRWKNDIPIFMEKERKSQDYRIEVMTVKGKETHGWLRLKDPDGHVYSVGTFWDPDYQLEGIRRFGSMPGYVKGAGDLQEFLGQEKHWKRTKIILNEDKFNELKEHIIQKQNQGISYNLINGNCTSFVSEILNDLGVQYKISDSPLVVYTMPKSIRKFLIKHQQVRNIVEFAAYPLRLIQNFALLLLGMWKKKDVEGLAKTGFSQLTHLFTWEKGVVDHPRQLRLLQEIMDEKWADEKGKICRILTGIIQIPANFSRDVRTFE